MWPFRRGKKKAQADSAFWKFLPKVEFTYFVLSFGEIASVFVFTVEHLDRDIG